MRDHLQTKSAKYALDIINGTLFMRNRLFFMQSRIWLHQSDYNMGVPFALSNGRVNPVPGKATCVLVSILVKNGRGTTKRVAGISIFYHFLAGVTETQNLTGNMPLYGIPPPGTILWISPCVFCHSAEIDLFSSSPPCPRLTPPYKRHSKNQFCSKSILAFD